jgi:hypothetical protein
VKQSNARPLYAGITVLGSLLLLTANSAEPPITKRTEKTGAQLFLALCASCHGALGRGDGPVASLLVSPPPDLTLISQRHNGFFPAVDVAKVIDGRAERIVHGTRSMPVWGRRLYFSANRNDDAARAHADEQVRLLGEYIRSIQQ